MHADETGWWVNGQTPLFRVHTEWLWFFAGVDATFYMTDRLRGSLALSKLFKKHLDGVLITDFCSPYDAISCADQQKCWPHLLRDAAKVSEKFSDHSEWKSFAQRLVGVFHDAKKLHSLREELVEADYDLAILRLEGHLVKMASERRSRDDGWRSA